MKKLSLYLLIIGLLITHEVHPQSQDVTIDTTEVALPSLAEMYYQSDINFALNFNFDDISKKQSLEFTSGELGTLTDLISGLYIGINPFLAYKYNWNLWIDIPVSITFLLSLALSSAFLQDYLGEKANSIEAATYASSYRRPAGLKNGNNSFSLLQYNIDSIIYVGGIMGDSLLNEMLNLYSTQYTQNSPQFAECLTWCALVCCLSGDLKQATEKLSVSNRLFKKNGQGPFNGRDTLNEILRLDTEGAIHYFDGLETKAIKCEERALELKKFYFGEKSKPHLIALLNLSRLYWESLRYSKSTKYHNIAFNAYVELIKKEFCNMGEYERSLYWSKAQKYISRTIDLAYNSTNSTTLFTHNSIPASCYNALLLSKGILLNTNVNYINHAKKYGDNAVHEMLEQRSKISTNKNAWIQIDSIDKRILKRLDDCGHKYTIPVLSVNWCNVAENIQKEDVAIEFFKTTLNQYGAAIIKRGWKTPRLIRLNNFVKVNKKNISLEKALQYVSINETEKFNKEDIWNVSRAIWTDELVKHFPTDTIGRIYFSADGSLQTFPLEYLPFVPPTDTSYHPISDLYNIYRLSSTRELVVRDTNLGKNGAAVFGGLWYNYNDIRSNYLNGTQIEADTVVGIIKRTNKEELRVDIYSRDEGTEENFKKLSGLGKRLMHIGTHGFYDTVTNINPTDYVNPMMQNGLIMSGYETHLMPSVDILNPTEDDGKLSALEVSSLNFSGLEIVVLSACNSGMGKILGDGVYGLQRAFKMANTKSVLMTLWEVDDWASQELMTQFYENWLIKKMTKQQALKTAQEYVRNFEITEREWEIYKVTHCIPRGMGDRHPSLARRSSNRDQQTYRLSRTFHPFQSPEYWAGFILLDGLD